ncbi:704_t:CDS:1, partial [Cetraspora pellucida]
SQQENLYTSEPKLLNNTLNVNNKTSNTSNIEWKESNKKHDNIDISSF